MALSKGRSGKAIRFWGRELCLNVLLSAKKKTTNKISFNNHHVMYIVKERGLSYMRAG